MGSEQDAQENPALVGKGRSQRASHAHECSGASRRCQRRGQFLGCRRAVYSVPISRPTCGGQLPTPPRFANRSHLDLQVRTHRTARLQHTGSHRMCAAARPVAGLPSESAPASSSNGPIKACSPVQASAAIGRLNSRHALLRSCTTRNRINPCDGSSWDASSDRHSSNLAKAALSRGGNANTVLCPRSRAGTSKSSWSGYREKRSRRPTRRGPDLPGGSLRR